jgi:homoisocitrate dehydrogenase
VIPAAQQVLAALGLDLSFDYAMAGWGVFQDTGNALPPETLAACESADAILFGATQSPMEKVAGYRSPILALRRHFDLFANLRPAKQGEIDLLIVRENTEGLYSGRERLEDEGQTAITERVITAAASRRIVELGAQLAMARPRQKLTLVHKANVLKETCGLFRRVGLEVLQNYPSLQVDEVLVDAAAMYLVQTPSRFDVIVTTNLFGDILSDLAAGLTGGLGLAPSANIGAGGPAVFEPVHGSAPDIAGQHKADPRAAILSGAMALDHLGYGEAGARVRAAVAATPHGGDTGATVAGVLGNLG